MSHIVIRSSSTDYSEPSTPRPLKKNAHKQDVFFWRRPLLSWITVVTCFDRFTSSYHEPFILCLLLIVVQWNSFWAANYMASQKGFNCIFLFLFRWLFPFCLWVDWLRFASAVHYLWYITVVFLCSGQPPDTFSKTSISSTLSLQL